MTVYLLEGYMPGSSAAELGDLAEHLSEVAHALSKDGLRVRYLRSTYVPEDETYFHFVEASTAGAVERFARRAELVFDRILEARNATVSPQRKGDGDE